MNPLCYKSEGARIPVKAWVDGVLFEDHAKAQIANVAKLKFVLNHIAVMPDVHAGKGSTVGTVYVTKDAIIPAAVGADIFCSMSAICLDMHLEGRMKDLAAVRKAVELAIPHGRTDNGGKYDKGAWLNGIPADVGREWDTNIKSRYNLLLGKHPKASAMNTVNQLGTLGSGNHFWELCLDENDILWVVVHSGSRGLGARMGQYFTDMAKKEMNKWFIELPDMELSYLPKGTSLFDDYLEAMRVCGLYAEASHDLMLKHSLDALGVKPGNEYVHCSHNFISEEKHFGDNVLVTRKGACRARASDMVIIPGSMGANTCICKGKGNRDSFTSCSHGAGRKMSRTDAKKQFTTADLVETTKGIECPKDSSIIDEIPLAYKDFGAVMKAQEELVEVVHTLHQIVNIKGGGE